MPRWDPADNVASARTALLVALALLGVSFFALWLQSQEVSSIRSAIHEVQLEVAKMNAPDFQSTITTGGVTTTVSTYCDTVPESWEGTCAAYHKKKIDDLKEAFPE